MNRKSCPLHVTVLISMLAAAHAPTVFDYSHAFDANEIRCGATLIE